MESVKLTEGQGSVIALRCQMKNLELRIKNVIVLKKVDKNPVPLSTLSPGKKVCCLHDVIFFVDFYFFPCQELLKHGIFI